MKPIRVSALLLMLIGLQSSVHAQQLSVAVQMDPLPSPYISEWRSKPNTVLLIVTNPTPNTREVRIAGSIQGDNRGLVARTKIDAPIPPILIPPGVTTLNAIDAHFIEEGAVEYIGSSRTETEQSGRLPEDRFRLCVQIVEYQSPNASLSPEMCAGFEVRFLLPPSLIAPARESMVNAPPAFQWSFVPMGTQLFASYELTLVQMDPGQTNAASAMESNLPVIVREISNPGTPTPPFYQYLPSDPTLEKGRTYAWRVRAYDHGNGYTFQNKGLSEIWTFVYDPVLPPSLKDGKATVLPGVIAPRGSDGASFSVQPNFVFSGLSHLSGRLLTTFLASQIPAPRSCIAQAGQKTSGTGKAGNTSKGAQVIGKSEVLIQPKGLKISGEKEAVPLSGIHLKLYLCTKSDPQCGPYNPIRGNGKSYDGRKLVATTTTKADGVFDFQFFSSDSTGRILSNSAISCGSGEFQNSLKADLYRYYVIEVSDPHLCSPDDEFLIQPGEAVSVGTLYSLVKWYTVTIRVQDLLKKSTLNNMDVELVRRTRPYDMPPNEGEITPPEVYSGSPAITNAVRIAKGKTKGSGEIAFKFLGLGSGGNDLYDVIVRSPDQGAYYYYTGWRQFSVIPGLNAKDDLGQSLPFLYGTALNSSYDPAEIHPTILVSVIPKKPRILGQVYRSDNPLKPVTNATVSLWAWAGLFPIKLASVLSNDSGGFSFENLNPTTNNAQFYWLEIDKYGFKKTVYPEDLGTNPIRLELGQQRQCNHVLIEPALVVKGRVIDEIGRPVAASVRIGDGEFVHTESHAISMAVLSSLVQHKKNENVQSSKLTTFTPSKALSKLRKTQAATVTIEEEFSTPAPYGIYWMYILPDNIASCYPETLMVALPKNAVDIGDFTVHLKLHRLAVRAVEYDGLAKKTKIGSKTGAQMSYAQFAEGTITKVIPNARITVNGELPDSVDAVGIAYFAWASPSDLATVRVEGPSNSDFITKEIAASVEESKQWNQLDVSLTHGGTVSGIVRIHSLPVPGARVMLYDNPAESEPMTTTTDSEGKFSLTGLPSGMHVFMASKSKSQYIGDTAAVVVKAGQTVTVDFLLSAYNDMDISSLLGFPIEVHSIDSSGSTIYLSGNFSPLPANPQFAPADSSVVLPFSHITIQPSGKKNLIGIPYAEPVSLPLATPLNELMISASHGYKALLRDASSGIRVQQPADRGEILGTVLIDPSSYTFPGGSVDFSTSRIALATTAIGNQRFTIPAITSDGSKSTSSSGFFIGDETGNALPFKFYDFSLHADSLRSYFHDDTLSLATVLHTAIPEIATPDLALSIGAIRVHKTSVEVITSSDSLSIPLEGKWAIRAKKWSIDNNGLNVHNGVLDAGGALTIACTGIKILPTQLFLGSFDLGSLPVADISVITVTGKASFGIDGGTKHWMLAVAPEPGEDVCGFIPALPGFASGEQVRFNNFFVRADDTQGFAVAPNTKVTLFKVGHYAINQFFPSPGLIQLAGNLNLNIPNFPVKNFISSYSKQDGDIVFTPDPMSQTISVNGVKITLVTAGTSPQYFDNDGFHSKVIVSEEGAFALKSLMHRTTTNTSLLVNNGEEVAIGPAVKLTDVEGAMSVQAGAWTNFWFEGDLQSSNQQGRLRFDVIGEITASNQQLGVQNIDTPFGDISLVYNFQKKQLEGNLHIDKDLNGSKVKGDATLLVSGAGKGWYFFCGASFELKDPKYEGSAALLFGNWTLEQNQLDQFAEYSYQNKPLPTQFHTLKGFFFEGSVKIPPPVFCPNFDFDFGLVSAHLTCQIGANARLGMNFGTVKTYYVAFRGIGHLEAGVGGSIGIACAGLSAGLNLEPNIEGVYQSNGSWFVKGDVPLTLYGECYAGWGLCDSDCEGTFCDKSSASANITLGLEAYVGSDDKYFKFYFK